MRRVVVRLKMVDSVVYLDFFSVAAVAVAVAVGAAFIFLWRKTRRHQQ